MLLPETSEDRLRRPELHPGAPIGDRCLHLTILAPADVSRRCRSVSILERWQNGNALASKASARKGLGVRIPRAPLRTKGPPGQTAGRSLPSLG